MSGKRIVREARADSEILNMKNDELSALLLRDPFPEERDERMLPGWHPTLTVFLSLLICLVILVIVCLCPEAVQVRSGAHLVSLISVILIF